MSKGPALYDPSLYRQAGINPASAIPRKNLVNERVESCLKLDIKKQLRVLDEECAVRRYQWVNLPKGLSSEMIERMLYYRGQLMFFKLDDIFMVLPYTLRAPDNSSGIDVYGRFTGITPVPFKGPMEVKDGAKKPIPIMNKTFIPRYEIFMPEDAMVNGELSETKLEEIIDNSAVIIRDYTQQESETSIPRYMLNDAVLDVMSDCVPFMRTALLNSTGVLGMRVNTEDEAASVLEASNAVNVAALTGKKYVPIIGTLEFQDMSGGDVAKSEEFLLAMQSLDNYRLSTYGLDNGGLFQKKSHMLEAEQEVNQGNVGLIYKDGLDQRQSACNIINSIWGTAIWCMPSETVIGVDTTGDGIVGDNEEGQHESNFEGMTGGESDVQ